MLTRPMALRGGREPRLEAEPSALLPPATKPGSLGNGGWRGGMEEKAFDGGAGEQAGPLDARMLESGAGRASRRPGPPVAR